MRYAGLIKNDIVNGKNICVSFFVQGCDIHCPGCHNPQTWDFDGGEELPKNILDQIDSAITANGIQRNFSILGGEPFAKQNITLTYTILSHVRNKFPDITIFAWTGYKIEDLWERDTITRNTIKLVNALIDGPYIKEQRDVTLSLRGSRNQRILYKGKDF